MLSLPKLRNRWAFALLGLTIFSLLFGHWYLGVSSAFFHTTPSGGEIVKVAEPAPVSPGDKNEVLKEPPPPETAPKNVWAPTKNAVVMAKLQKENTEWVHELEDWESVIYKVDDPTAKLQPPKNKGNEAMVYLSYIIDFYDNLPPVSAFIHSHKDGYPKAWHTDAEGYSNVVSLKKLRLDTVLQRGYVNLRCNWIPGCPDEIQPFRTTDADRTAEHDYSIAWKAMFGNSSTSPPVPETVGAACCAQFAVSRDRILARTKAEYEQYRNWILTTPLDNATSGRIMEYMWHIIFGESNVFCPEYNKCFCDVYGRC